MWSKHPLTAALAATALLTACGDDSKPDFYNGTGLLDVTLEVVSPDGIGLTLPDPADFRFELMSVGEESSSHVWESFSSFRQGARYLAGEYVFTATHGDVTEEGFDLPFFRAMAQTRIEEGAATSVSLTATLANVPVTLTSTDAFNSAHPGWTADIHSAGGRYIGFDRAESRTAYMRAEPLSVSVGLNDGKAIFSLARAVGTDAGRLMAFTLDAEADDVVLTCNGREVRRLTVTREMLLAPWPEVSLSGASTTATLPLLERTRPAVPVAFTVDSPTEPAEVTFTIDSPSLQAIGAPPEINLMSPDDNSRRFLENIGMLIPEFARGATQFDITPLLAQIQYRGDISPTSRLSLTVTDASGRQSRPVELTVSTIPFDINVISATPAVIGINTVDITVAAPSASVSDEMTIVAREADGTLAPAEIIEAVALDNATYRVTVRIPEGNTPLTLLAYYGTELKAELPVERVSPSYTISCDAFATRVRLLVQCPGNESLVPVITRGLTLTSDGNSATVLGRDEKTGIITVIGLTPSRAYTLEATLQPGNAAALHRPAFTTEAATPLPNGDFEDTKKSIDMRDMPSGGRYSQTFAEIFNCQNKASYRHDAPTGWANTNVKTFNTGSRNRNTWYMQPSVYTIEDRMSGDYAVELVSVAFDPDGAAIADYLQESTPYTRYSRNIPDITWRAAGKIFLGTYSFNPFPSPVESYVEGIGFRSRPTSLNGFYIFEPSAADPADRGLVSVEVLGIDGDREITIAGGTLRLDPSTGYTAFTIPLNYSRFGVKATRIKVMAASSRNIGSLHAETVNIITRPDPVSSTSTGSRLRLDNLTFAY